MAAKENKPKALARILLIDDEDHYIDNLTRRMQKLNWEPTLTSSYADAFKLLEFETFDVVCIDIRLGPEKSEALGILEKIHSNDGLPIVAFSTRPGVDEEAIRAGAEISMTRPSSPEALENVIESIVIKSRLQKERYSCFISYSHKDELFAKKLHGDLQKEGVRCWFAPHNLGIGAKTRNAIHEAIKSHEKLLLVLSRYSVLSDWVEDEVSKALELESRQKQLILFPIRLDNAVMKIDSGWPATVRGTRNIGDFSKWKRDARAYRDSFNSLLRALKKV